MMNSFVRMFLLSWLVIILSGCNDNIVVKGSKSTTQVRTPGFSIENVRSNEGSTMAFEVKLSDPLTSDASVDFATFDGSASSGIHYASETGTLIFSAGETIKTISINTTSDSNEVCGPDRNFSVKLANPVGSSLARDTAVGTIVDPDVPSLSINDSSAAEGSPISFSVTLSELCQTKNVTFRWKTTNGSATTTTDFTGVDSSAVIPANTLSLPLSVTTVNDSIYEGDETFTVALSSPSNATIGTGTGTMTITENDTVPVVQFSTAAQTIPEFMGTTTATVSLSHPSSYDVSVPFTLSGTAAVGTGNDFIVSSSPVTIPAGSVNAIITVTLNNDVLSETDETIVLGIDSPSNATKGPVDTHTITITDNDAASVINVTSSLADGTYTSGDIDISVQFSSNVNVMGTPLLTLNTAPVRYASYVSGSGSSTLVFRYTIQYDDSSSKLDYSSIGALALSGGTIKDSVNLANANLTLPLPGAYGSLGMNKSIKIAALTIPKITSITMPEPGLYKRGDELQFEVNFSEEVVIGDLAGFMMKIGTANDFALYVSGSGSKTLVFLKPIEGGEFGTTVEVLSPIMVMMIPIKSLAGVNADLTFSPSFATDVIVDAIMRVVGFEVPVVSLPENSSVGKKAKVTINQPAYDDITLPVRTMGSASANVDFVVHETSVTIPAGQTTAFINYDVIDDATDEVNESFTILLDRTASTANIALAEAYGMKVEIYDNEGTKEKWKVIKSALEHSCAITAAGVLKCWGENMVGKLGDTTSQARVAPVTIDAGTSYKQISPGLNHTCGITTAGVLKCWGNNYYGELGTGQSQTSDATPAVIDAGTPYLDVSVYGTYTCGITNAAVLKCWGSFDGVTQVLTPAVIDSGTGYLSVSTGYEHACAITTSNVLKCWGKNDQGQVGTGDTFTVPSPVVVDAGSGYQKIQAGSRYTCGLLTTGTLKCWGTNWSGQIGNGGFGSELSPVIVDPGVDYLTIGTSEDYACGITDAYIIKCWGVATTGLGGYFASSRVPEVLLTVDTFKDLSIGDGLYCATTTTDDIKCWGRNIASSQGSPSMAIESLPLVVNPNAPYKFITSSQKNTCVITNWDSLFCWGGSQSRLPDESSSIRYSPVWIDPGATYKSVALGWDVSCGITLDNKLKCWGDNVSYFSKSPQPWDPATSYIMVSAGDGHACGITDTGVLKCWGNNYRYQLGTGDTDSREEATEIMAGTTFKYVSNGYNHSCAITSGDKLMCWGANDDGTVGNGTTNDQSTPVEIDPGVNYKIVTAGYLSSCGITMDDHLKCWGQDNGGSLGIGAISGNKTLTPVSVDALTTYRDVKIEGAGNVCALTTANVLKCWGYNDHGAIGNGTLVDQTTPQIIDPGVSYKLMTTGSNMACGLTDANVFKCWGSNLRGEFGNTFGFMMPLSLGDY